MKEHIEIKTRLNLTNSIEKFFKFKLFKFNNLS